MQNQQIIKKKKIYKIILYTNEKQYPQEET